MQCCIQNAQLLWYLFQLIKISFNFFERINFIIMNLQVGLEIFLKTDFPYRVSLNSVVSKSMVTNHFHPKIFDFVVKLVPQHLKCVNPMDFQSLIESKQKTIACDVKFQTVFGLQVFYFSRFLRQYTTGISSLKMTFIESNFDVQSCTTFRIKIEYEIEFHSVFAVKTLLSANYKEGEKNVRPSYNLYAESQMGSTN